MPIYFCNAEPINLMAFEIMGLHVKEGDQPIGHFGTGLKYGVATLLRLGCTIEVTRRTHEVAQTLLETITFETDRQEMRGKEFHRVVMVKSDGVVKSRQPLGFTTELGKQWEAWMAFRELHSNVLDEGGVTSDQMPQGTWGTVIKVTGRAIEEAYQQMPRIFLDPRLHRLESVDPEPRCEIIPLVGKFIYYRGVRVGEFEAIAPLATYNFRAKMALTEDRTLLLGYNTRYSIMASVMTLKDENFIRQVVLAQQPQFEAFLEFSEYLAPSESFLRVVERERKNHKLNASARKVWERANPDKVALDWEDQETTSEVHLRQLEKAYALLARLGVVMKREDFLVVRGLGADVMGLYSKSGDQILLAESTLDQGYRVIASTLYEEWLHKNEGLGDESRSMQNFLFNKLFAVLDSAPKMVNTSPMVELTLDLNDEIPF